MARDMAVSPRECSDDSETSEEEDAFDLTDSPSLHDLHGDLQDLPSNMYGATIALFVHTAHHFRHGKRSDLPLMWGSLFYGLFMQFFTIFIQVCLVFWTRKYIMFGSVHSLQVLYKEYHELAFNEEGEFQVDLWESYNPLKMKALCNAALTKPPFLFIILFLWSSTMVNECKRTWRLMRMVRRSSDAHSHLKKNKEDGTYLINGIDRCSRVGIYTLILIPKCIINVYIWWLGLGWLTATTSFADVIINALALAFILDIDELILVCFMPENTQQRLIDATKFDTSHSEGPVQEPCDISPLAMSYIKNLAIFLGVIAFVVTYLKFFQPVLPGYNFDLHANCDTYVVASEEIECGAFDKGCFPYGSSNLTDE